MTSSIKLTWFEENKNKPEKIKRVQNKYWRRISSLRQSIEKMEILGVEFNDEFLKKFSERFIFYVFEYSKLYSYLTFIKDNDWRWKKIYFDEKKDERKINRVKELVNDYKKGKKYLFACYQLF